MLKVPHLSGVEENQAKQQMSNKSTERYTKTDNWLFDIVMRQARPNTFKVVSAVVRLTSGWHKETAVITFADFQEITGIDNRGTLTSAISDALESGFVYRVSDGKSFSYGLRIVPIEQDNQSENRTNEEALQSKNRTDNDQSKNRTTVRKSYKNQSENHTEIGLKIVPSTGEPKEKKEIKENNELPKKVIHNGNERKLTPQQEMLQALCDVMEKEVSLNAARYGKFASDLLKLGYSAEQIKTWYSKTGWYRRNNYQGKQGKVPNEAIIRATILDAKRANSNTNGNATNGLAYNVRMLEGV